MHAERTTWGHTDFASYLCGMDPDIWVNVAEVIEGRARAQEVMSETKIA
jgi:hypothetical protein